VELEYLFAGFAVFWAGLLAYLVWLQARLRSLQRDVEHLEERLAEEAPLSAAASPAAPRASSSPVIAPGGEPSITD
jgi:CcmD family protein